MRIYQTHKQTIHFVFHYKTLIPSKSFFAKLYGSYPAMGAWTEACVNSSRHYLAIGGSNPTWGRCLYR